MKKKIKMLTNCSDQTREISLCFGSCSDHRHSKTNIKMVKISSAEKCIHYIVIWV